MAIRTPSKEEIESAKVRIIGLLKMIIRLLIKKDKIWQETITAIYEHREPPPPEVEKRIDEMLDSADDHIARTLTDLFGVSEEYLGEILFMCPPFRHTDPEKRADAEKAADILKKMGFIPDDEIDVINQSSWSDELGGREEYDEVRYFYLRGHEDKGPALAAYSFFTREWDYDEYGGRINETESYGYSIRSVLTANLAFWARFLERLE